MVEIKLLHCRREETFLYDYRVGTLGVFICVFSPVVYYFMLDSNEDGLFRQKTLKGKMPRNS